MAKTPPPTVTPARQPSSVISEPATIAACRADYASSAGVNARTAMAKHAARARRG